MSEEQTVREIIEHMSDGGDISNKLGYDPPTRSLRPARYCNDADNPTAFANQDSHLYYWKGGRSQ